MADNYIPQGSYKDIQVLSPTAVIDAMVLTAFTIPSHIYFEVYVPMDAYRQGSGPNYLAATAAGLESLRASEGVTAVHFETDLDAAGLVAEYAVATVGITPPMGATGPFTTEVQFPMPTLALSPALFAAAVTGQLQAAIADLQALAAS